MLKIVMVTLFSILSCLQSLHAQVIDDFSKNDWNQSNSTPGRVSQAKGKLHLIDSPESPDWITVSKRFSINLDQTPLFIVNVTSLSDQGTVKLIRKKTYDKQVAIQIDRPGIYSIDIPKKFGWQGSAQIDVCLYAIGDQEEITYKYIRFDKNLTTAEEEHVQSSQNGANVKLIVKPFEIVSSFNTCSYYFKSPKRNTISVLYRRQGGLWNSVYPPVYVKEDNMYRGSIVHLQEDTPYELKITDKDGTILAQQSFHTWSSEVPIGKTIVLDESNFNSTFTLTENGSKESWIKVTAKKGFILQNDRKAPLIELNHAKYILFEGLTLRGGLQQAISLKKCHNIRIINCDIAGWGRIGTQRFDLDGKFYTDSGRAINWDTAILVSKCTNTVIERCYIHDPVTTANSWYYSHPAGPQAVGMDKSPSTVLRYNDFIGSDKHRWNDAVEGSGNFHIDGGFNRDGDVYGNFMCFANDDAIEIDGGQTNVRVFQNKFEGCLCGVSIQGCMSGPSYVFNNLLVNMGDQRGKAGQTIKTSSSANGPAATSFIFNNTSFNTATDLPLRSDLRIVAFNNIFAGKSSISGRQRSPQSQCNYNLLSTGKPGDESHGVIGHPNLTNPEAGLFNLDKGSLGINQGIHLDNFSPTDNSHPDLGAIPFGSDTFLPVRPIPIRLDRYQLNFSATDLKAGQSKSITATVAGKDFSHSYSIAINSAFDWFDVTPANGKLVSGQTQTFTVTLHPEKMNSQSIYRGAFLIRLDNGLSCPVMVYAHTDWTAAIKPAIPTSSWTTYIEAESSAKGTSYTTTTDTDASGGAYLVLAGPAKKNPIEYQFNIPKTGTYFLLLRAKSPDNHTSLYFAIDNGPIDRTKLRYNPDWSWSLAAHNSDMSLICLEPIKLSAGPHFLKLSPRESLHIDLIAITDNPIPFE